MLYRVVEEAKTVQKKQHCLCLPVPTLSGHSRAGCSNRGWSDTFLSHLSVAWILSNSLSSDYINIRVDEPQSDSCTSKNERRKEAVRIQRPYDVPNAVGGARIEHSHWNAMPSAKARHPSYGTTKEIYSFPEWSLTVER
jgi:hypothetical protein